jgi:mono/diheme cytochrome c family protein
MSYSQLTGLVYIPAMEAAFPFVPDSDFSFKEQAWNTGADFGTGAMPEDPEIQEQVLSHVNGHLSAWDPVAQEEKWRVQHPGAWNAGVLTTAGNLLVQGQGDGNFTIYRADSGEQLWSFFAQSGIVAAPVTYLVDGEQYITVVVGWGGIMALAPGLVGRKGNLPRNISRVLTFKLGGLGSLPDAPPELARTLVVSDREVGEEAAARGKHLYHHYCVNCHGDIAVSAGLVPDLRYSAIPGTDAWFTIVRDGSLESRGMVGFGPVLSDEDLTAIESYVILRARNSAESGE